MRWLLALAILVPFVYLWGYEPVGLRDDALGHLVAFS